MSVGPEDKTRQGMCQSMTGEGEGGSGNNKYSFLLTSITKSGQQGPPQGLIMEMNGQQGKLN